MNTATILWRDLLRQVRLLPLIAFFTALPLSAQIPSLINYQGRLTDAQGNPVTGNRTMAVRIYDAPSGGNMTYEETIGTVAVVNGTYSFRFGSGGSVAASASETIATTNGLNQIFNGTLQGIPSGGIVSLTDGVFSWSSSAGSSNSSAFSVTYNSTARSFQIFYFAQVPAAGRAIVASYQTKQLQTIDASLADGTAYLALSVNGTEEATRARLLAVPYALKAKESEDAQALVQQMDELEAQTIELGTNVETVAAALSANMTAVQEQAQSVNATVSGLLAQFKVLGLSGSLAFGNSTNSGTLEISNSGFGRLTVTGIEYPPGFSGDWNGGIINQGSSAWVNVAFTPTAVQGYSGNIVVVSDATSGTGTIPVSGEGARWISLSGDLAFGNGTVNVPNQRVFTISNTGTMDLTVSGINYPSGFSGNWSGTIAPGGSQSVSAIFTPTAVQAYSGNLSVVSNASGGSGLLAVSGSGLAAPPQSGNFVTVQGGTLPQSSQLSGQIVATFEIGKYEVTWGEWQEVRTWAVANGYSDLANVGAGSAGNHPVRDVNWFDIVKWSNAKSEKEGLVPVYQVSGAVYKTGQSEPTVNSAANGYRLPTEAEWEWAARGGVSSQGYTYSGSNDVNAVAWYLDNSSGAAVDFWDGRGTWPVGEKAANELGLHDMSGNVWEWCWDLVGYSRRRVRGGYWFSDAGYCAVAGRAYGGDYPVFRGNGVGFRLARSSGN